MRQLGLIRGPITLILGFISSPRLQASCRSLNIALPRPENSWTYQGSTIFSLKTFQPVSVDLSCAEFDPLDKSVRPEILETIPSPGLNSLPTSTSFSYNQNQCNNDHLTGPQSSAQDLFQQNPDPAGGSTVHSIGNVNMDILEKVSPFGCKLNTTVNHLDPFSPEAPQQTTEANSFSIRYEFRLPSALPIYPKNFPFNSSSSSAHLIPNR